MMDFCRISRAVACRATAVPAGAESLSRFAWNGTGTFPVVVSGAGENGQQTATWVQTPGRRLLAVRKLESPAVGRTQTRALQPLELQPLETGGQAVSLRRVLRPASSPAPDLSSGTARGLFCETKAVRSEFDRQSIAIPFVSQQLEMRLGCATGLFRDARAS